GVCTTDFKICISDPFYDGLEGEPPAGSAHGATVHNDASNISGPHGQIQHDQYTLSSTSFGCIAGGVTAELVSGYPATGDLANFAGQNGEAECGFEQPLFVVIENAYVICPPDADSDGVCDFEDNCPADFNPLQEDFNGDGIGDSCCCDGLRGNVFPDTTIDVNVLDLVFMVDWVFRGSGNRGGCPDESDVNADGSPADILDLTYLVDRIFRGGPPPPPC
ncbi:MAG: hypothetical protein IH931_08950, partial [candidate division Zixibacteria bacterium]|nr:hypothetical protein [candidate division Zixibacteria bacterium]